jgi:hypothetical protein
MPRPRSVQVCSAQRVVFAALCRQQAVHVVCRHNCRQSHIDVCFDNTRQRVVRHDTRHNVVEQRTNHTHVIDCNQYLIDNIHTGGNRWRTSIRLQRRRTATMVDRCTGGRRSTALHRRSGRRRICAEAAQQRRQLRGQQQRQQHARL